LAVGHDADLSRTADNSSAEASLAFVEGTSWHIRLEPGNREPYALDSRRGMRQEWASGCRRGSWPLRQGVLQPADL